MLSSLYIIYKCIQVWQSKRDIFSYFEPLGGQLKQNKELLEYFPHTWHCREEPPSPNAAFLSMPFAFQFDIKWKAEIKFAKVRRSARHSLSASLHFTTPSKRSIRFFHLKFLNIVNSGLDSAATNSDNPSCALCLWMKTLCCSCSSEAAC